MNVTQKSNFFPFSSSHDVIPIVMGARPEDYAKSAPHKSFIHVDDFDGPKELAEYLHKVDQDDQLYNEYFKWKVSYLCTEWKFHDFPIIQILCEIDAGETRSSKTAVFAILRA